MTIIPTIEAWPTKLVRKSDGHWHPSGCEPTEPVKRVLGALVNDARRQWFTRHEFEPTHLVVGFDCREEYLRQFVLEFGMTREVQPYSVDQFQGLSLIWAQSPGIHLLFDGR